MSERLETPIAHDWRKNVSSQTVVECWRRDRQLWSDGDVSYIIQKDSPILTAMCTCSAPELTKNSRSSGLFGVGAGITLASIGL